MTSLTSIAFADQAHLRAHLSSALSLSLALSLSSEFSSSSVRPRGHLIGISLSSLGKS